MGKVCGLAALAGLLVTAFAGQASASVVYDLTLTANYDSDGAPLSTYSGTGTITLDSLPDPTWVSSYASAPVTFLIDGQSFSGTASAVVFQFGDFWNAQFSQEIGVSPLRFDLQTSGVYAFYFADEQQAAYGSITSALAPVAAPVVAPLPAALPLFVSGLGGLGFFGWRRNKKVKALAA
jgi:hypothetical protein